MPYPVKDCDCEDFPCCQHADNFPVSDDPYDYYCDQCGLNHAGNCPADDYDDDAEDFDEDEAVLTGRI